MLRLRIKVGEEVLCVGKPMVWKLWKYKHQLKLKPKINSEMTKVMVTCKDEENDSNKLRIERSETNEAVVNTITKRKIKRTSIDSRHDEFISPWKGKLRRSPDRCSQPSSFVLFFRMKTTLFLWTAFLLCCVSLASDDVRSRQRRMIWPTKNGGFALPTGTRLRVDFGLSGVLSPLTMHLPFTIDFDSLGWTDDENPFGNFFVQRMGKTIGWLFTGQEEEHRRTARSVNATHQPKDFESLGIDRSIVYVMLENVLGKFDVDGKACLLRATCEVHLHSDAVEQYGFAGKTILSFFTSDRSDGPMKDYVAAQMAAKSGDKCHSYFEDCPNSLFSSQPTSKPLKKRTVEDIDPFRLTNNGSIPLTEEDLQDYGKNSTTKKRHFDEIDKTALVRTGEISKKEKKN